MTPISFTAPQFTDDFQSVREALELAGPLGFSGVFFFDHLIPLGNPHRPVLELASVLGAASAVADVRIGTLVMRAPLRGAPLSFSIAATAQMFNSGRFVLGLGAGDSLSRSEATRFGLTVTPLEARIEAVADAAREAKAHGIATWIGGTHVRILEVTAELAGGWNGWGLDPGDLGTLCRRLRGERSDLTLTWGGAVLIGRDAEDLDGLVQARGGDEGVVAGTPQEIRSRLTQMVEAGADELIVSVLPNNRNRWQLFAEQVLGRL